MKIKDVLSNDSVIQIKEVDQSQEINVLGETLENLSVQ